MITGVIILYLLKTKDIIRELPPLTMPNTGNMGLPICLFAYGSQGLGVSAAISALIILCHFTLGVFLADRKFSLNVILKSPPFYAIIIAIFLLYGRRKTSIARVWLKKGSGKIYVNGKLFSDYFASDNHKMQITRPFELINQATDYDVRCSVKGGGPTGQAGAMVHGISKALVLFDENLKSTLRTEKLTTRDSRAVERKKPGRRKARRSFQFSKR